MFRYTSREETIHRICNFQFRCLIMPINKFSLCLVGFALVMLGASHHSLAVETAPQGELAQKLTGIQFKHYAQAPGYSEGPTWRNGEVVFCSGALLRVTPEGRVGRYLGINPAGTVLRHDGSLLICDNKHKALLELTDQGKINVLAEACDGEKLKSLNDLTIDARGNVYWSDPEGSSLAKPVGSVLRLTPAGVVSRVATGLAFPNGLDVDPASKFLYVIESQSKNILRYALPEGDDQPLGERTEFYDLGGSGGDGCAFDAQGNLWVADFHRLETKHGRITVLDPQAKVLAQLEVPAQVVSNIAFGGPKHDEIFCTTGTPAGVFHAAVGVVGFRGHPGVQTKVLRELVIDPVDEASTVTPRKFGVPGGIGATRGWYIWRKWDPATWEAEVSKDQPDSEVYQVRVLPWCTTYRQLAYGARPDELLVGERVNIFFNPDERHSRGYLVHFQDEMCQMKGHAHYWEVVSADDKAREFTARAMASDKPLEAEPRSFQLASDVAIWRDGKLAPTSLPKRGDRAYLRWCVEEQKRVVHLVADDASLETLRRAATDKYNDEVMREGMSGLIESVTGSQVQFLAFSTHWTHAGQLKPGQLVRLSRTTTGYRPTGDAIAGKVVSQKNRGTYGSGVNDMVIELSDEKASAVINKWPRNEVIRLIPSP
jgi:gluconolactonase